MWGKGLVTKVDSFGFVFADMTTDLLAQCYQRSVICQTERREVHVIYRKCTFSWLPGVARAMRKTKPAPLNHQKLMQRQKELMRKTGGNPQIAAREEKRSQKERRFKEPFLESVEDQYTGYTFQDLEAKMDQITVSDNMATSQVNWFQYGAVPLWGGQFSPKYSRKTPHSSPVRASYWVSFVDSASDWYSAQYHIIFDRVITSLSYI